jgi:hypothetical protein
MSYRYFHSLVIILRGIQWLQSKSSHYGSVYSIDTLETTEVSSDGGGCREFHSTEYNDPAMKHICGDYVIN